MATIDAGRVNARDVNRDVPLIPFIDFLLCLVAFLLVTAVWSRMAALDADAQVPGVQGPSAPLATLHVKLQSERHFRLEWRKDGTVLHTLDVERHEVPTAGQPSYPALARTIEAEWKARGSHRSASDPSLDRAVLHTSHGTEFGDLVAVIDAIKRPKRAFTTDGKTTEVPAFAVAFATN